MKQFRNISIRWKLTLLAVATSLLTLLGTGIAFSVIDHRMTEMAMIEEYSTTADVIGQNGLASLEFSDSRDAKSVLASLRLDPQVSLAVLYDANQKPFASFVRDDAEVPTMEQTRSAPVTFASDGFMHLNRPIRRDDKIVGYLYFRISLEKLWIRLWSQLKLTAIVLFVSLLLSIALAAGLQRAISNPILQLVETAHRVINTSDYSLRAQKLSDDELGQLVSEFNQMLTAIQVRDNELRRHRENLTELVRERTLKLEKKTEEALAASVAKSNFLANMSHEIRTPLNAIMGYADLLRRNWNDSPEERDEMLMTVHSSGCHLMTIINDILDLSKIEAGHFELERRPESPRAILSSVDSLMRASFQEKGLSLDFRWDGPVPETIETDGQGLRQILINLLGNAKKFTPSGGVRVLAQIEQQSESSRLIINVIDTGVGIPLEKQNQIFEPFTQADTSVTRRFGGSGLGLSISRRLARLMGGDLTVEHSTTEGSNFRLSIETGDLSQIRTLPSSHVIHDVPSEFEVCESSDDTIQLNDVRVLLVDDRASNRKLMSLIINRAGAKLTLATDGKQACDLALSGQSFDVILMDMQMPVMDGCTAARTLRNAGLTTPIIALTAHAMRGDRELCFAAGCSDFFTKPFSVSELLERIDTLVVRGPTLETIARSASDDTLAIRSTLPVDDPEFAAIVIDFIPSLRREVSRLAEVIEQRDPKEVLETAHWIKGAAGTAGFGCFTSPAAQIYTAIRTNDWAEIDCLMLTIQDYADRLEAPELVMTSV